MKKVIIVIFFLFISLSNYAQFLFLGPMFHYNIGIKNKNRFSWGLEAAYWPKHGIGSIDLGFEFESEKTRIYSELQTGFLVGISAGYVREFYVDKESKGGFQTSLWGAWFGGVDIRYRYLNGNHFIAPGLFVKYPVVAENITLN